MNQARRPDSEPTPLAPLVTFGVGGAAAFYRRVKTPTELVSAVRECRERRQKYWFVAGGSNVIFPDGLFPGCVIHYLNPRGVIHCQGNALTVEAGAPLARLVRAAIRNGLAGLEALSGIPGTIGGAVVGNAGAYGQAISDWLTRVQVFIPPSTTPLSEHPSLIKEGKGEVVGGGEIKWLTKAECRFTYRDSIFKQVAGRNWLVLRVEFRLTAGDRKSLAKKSREIIRLRAKKYPPGLRCPGSFFKNVLVKDLSRITLDKIDRSKIIAGKVPAGYLLAAAGACGRRVGDVYVADYHGNLIVNGGRGTAAEVKKLATELKRRVRQKFGIELEAEVRFL